MTPDNNPAAALHHLLADPKASRNDRGRVALLVGETCDAWSKYCTGKKDPGSKKQRKWSERTGTMLVCTGGTWGAMYAPLTRTDSKPRSAS